jgi:hypothetical protein
VDVDVDARLDFYGTSGFIPMRRILSPIAVSRITEPHRRLKIILGPDEGNLYKTEIAL